MDLVNIPRSNTDSFYRYKMPIIKTKIEGKGNGIRTVVTNMGKIMKALDRPLEYGTKFIGFELGAQTKVDLTQNNCTISGKHSDEQLAQHLDKFIDMYVLCTKCKNPETILEIKKNMITSKCKACGKLFKIDMTHKLSNFIFKTESNKKPTKNKNDLVKVIKKNDDHSDGEKWSMDTSDGAVSERKQQLHCDIDAKKINQLIDVYPMENLVKYVNSAPNNEQFTDALNMLKSVHHWHDSVLIKYIFMGLFSDGNIRHNFYNKIMYIDNFVVEQKDMFLILTCVEKLVEENETLMSEFIHILNGLFENGVVEEDVILQWYSNKSKVVSEALSLKIKENVTPFIDWLENAEIDD